LQQKRLVAYGYTNELYQYALTLTPPAKSKKAVQEVVGVNNTITLLFNVSDTYTSDLHF